MQSTGGSPSIISQKWSRGIRPVTAAALAGSGRTPAKRKTMSSGAMTMLGKTCESEARI
ncbi:hypothetical protein D3C87_2195500 [compost metagenome]